MRGKGGEERRDRGRERQTEREGMMETRQGRGGRVHNKPREMVTVSEGRWWRGGTGEGAGVGSE